MRSCLHRMINSRNTHKGWEISMTGLLYQFFSILIDQANSRASSTHAGLFEGNVRYAGNGLHRNELCQCRYRSVHRGPCRFAAAATCALCSRIRWEAVFKSYLVHYRMRRAAELTLDPGLTIGDIARLWAITINCFSPKCSKK